jgi:hypothetical protein
MKTTGLSSVLIGLASGLHAATFTVTNTAGTGPGSLNQAIIDSNTNAGPDTIEFAIEPFDGMVKTIAQSNNLTDIIGPTIIDGFTQPGSSSNTLANGNNAVLLIAINTPTANPGLNFQTGGNTLRGLIINGNGSGVFIQSAASNNVIEGCFIGTDATGMTNGTPQMTTGLNVQSFGNRIGGANPGARNVIGGCLNDGIILSGGGASNNVIVGNYIGTDINATAKIPNGNGISVTSASSNRIGGATIGERNIVSGNTAGLSLGGSGGKNVVQGNYIGTDVTGLLALGNITGISVSSSTNTIGGATGAHGTPPGNLVSGNTGQGISLGGGAGHVVEGNLIGTDATGTNDLGNGLDGIVLNVADSVISNNVVSGNNQTGILTTGSGGSRNWIVGNWIGTDVSGMRNLSNNSFGVRNGGGWDNVCSNNVIAFNGDHAIQHAGSSSTNNTITGNSIHSNAKLGINLFTSGDTTSGATSNDVCDADSGVANFLQNYPVLTNAASDASSVTIQGFLPSAANMTYTLEFFANTACDPSGHGEGEQFLGSTNVATDATCTNAFSVTFPVAVADAMLITATATDPNGNTSEFSACRTNVSNAATNCITPPSGLIAWWPGDGNAQDIIGGNHGSLSNGASFAGGKVSQAFDLDGTNDFIQLPGNAEWNFGTNDFSIDFWAISSNSSMRMHALSFDPSNVARNLNFDFNDPDPPGVGQPNVGLWVYWNSTGVNQITAGTPGQFTDGMWHHYTLTRSGTVFRLYVDAVEVGSTNYSGAIDLSAPANNYIGTSEDSGSKFFFWDGMIDEVELFNRALSGSEIQSIFNAGSFGKCKPDTNSPPQITCPDNIITNAATNQCSRSVSFSVDATGSPDPTVTCTTNSSVVTSPVVFPRGITTVSCIASNTVGTTNCSFTVTVNDTQPPGITCPDNVVTSTAPGTCARTVSFAPTVSDNCGVASTNCTPPSGSSFAKGTNTVNCTVTDTSGNTNGCSFTITVRDLELPGISNCPGNITSNVTAPATSAMVTYAAPAVSDNCGVASTNCAPPSGSTFSLGTTNVTCTVIDTSANTNTCSFMVTVNQLGGSNNPPVAACQDVTRPAGAGCQTNVPASAVNNGSSDPDGDPITLSLTPPGPYGLGTNAVTLTVADNRGGTSSCPAQVIVTDSTAPSITCPATIATNVPAGTSNAVVHFSAPTTVSDTCPVSSTNCVPPSGSTFPLGTNQVVCTATDGSGNAAQCMFFVVVRETAPEAHDLIVLKVKVPKTINLTAAAPALTKQVSVQIRNLSEHEEVIPDFATLSNLVQVTVISLGECAAPAAVVVAGPPNIVPTVLGPGKKMNVFFDVTFECANFPAKFDKKTGENADFEYMVHVNHAALDGEADTAPANDDCPRPPNPLTKDKGCGGKGPDGALLTDVVGK